MKIKVLTKVKEAIQEYQREKELERIREKAQVVELVTRKWSQVELDSFNINQMSQLGGCIGKFSERAAKRSMLVDSRDLFTEDEFNELLYLIENNTKTRIK